MGSVDHQPHVALLAFPFGTHAAPLLSLASALAASSTAGATFSLLTSARSAASLSRASCLVRNLRVVEISDGCPDGYVTSATDPEEEVRMFMGAAPSNLEKGLEMAVEKAGGVITCVVSDAFLWFAGNMADRMRVPWVALWTGGPCSLSAHLHTDLLRREIGVGEQAITSRGRGEEDLGFIKGLSGIRARDIPEGIVSGNLDGLFAELLHRMGHELPHATAVALNSFEGLTPELDSDFSSKFKQSLPVGPLHLMNTNYPASPRAESVLERRPNDCALQWLDRQKQASVAYISFGTIMSLAPPELAELAEGLEASGVPFLWSMRDSAKEQLPAGFLDRTRDRGLVVPWAPQVDVLRHKATGAFLTHCGWNSVLESITCGVPMLCRPFLGDQMMNARTISHVWKVGVGFDGARMKKDEVARAMETVLKEEEGKMMREKIAGFKEKAIAAVQPDGSSVRNFKALLELILVRN